MKFLYVNGETIHLYERNENHYFLLKDKQLMQIKEMDYLLLNAFKMFGIFQENEVFLNQLLDFLRKLEFNLELSNLIKLIHNFKEKSILITVKAETEIVSLMKINRVNDYILNNEINSYLMNKYHIQVYNKFIFNNIFMMNSHLKDELYQLIISIVNFNNYENKMGFLDLVEKTFLICHDEKTSFKEYTREEIISIIIDLISLNHLKINK